MGSSGGGTAKAPNQATPSGTITPFGGSTPFSPSYNSVLTNGMGWADVGEIDAANDANATATAQRAQQAAAAPQAAAANPLTSADAFAQQLLDYQKQQQFGRMMMGFGPQGMVQGIQAMRAPAPQPQGAMQQLMAQALQSRQASGGRPSGSYSGGGHLR